MYRFIIGGNNRVVSNFLKENLPAENFQFEYIPDNKKLLMQAEETFPDGIILAFTTPGWNELKFIRSLFNLKSVPATLILSDYLTTAQAVSCLRLGAVDCINGKPEIEIIIKVLKRIVKHNSHFPPIFSSPENKIFIHGKSNKTIKMLNTAQNFSSFDFPVLITGETGSGKELAARVIHASGKRSGKPFTAVNCAALPEELMVSELFGTSKGAYTGSLERGGLFEKTSGGTLFLDEIGELSSRNQSVLLRAVENNEIRRLGSAASRKVNIRIIAATNRNLKTQIHAGKFRKDLYYRLNFLSISISPLRERNEDIMPLAVHFLKKLRPEKKYIINKEAEEKLLEYSWPGNVRELQSVILKSTFSTNTQIISPADIIFE